MNELEQPEVFDTPISIAVIADTHFGDRPRSLPQIVIDALRQSDLILHVGDFCSVEAYDMIAGLGELRGVHGNNDALPIVRVLPARRTFRFGHFAAVMIHGHGAGRLTARQTAELELRGEFDIVIFGHSHQPYRKWHEGKLLFNPGSPTQRRWEPRHSFGVIKIDKEIDATIHYLES